MMVGSKTSIIRGWAESKVLPPRYANVNIIVAWIPGGSPLNRIASSKSESIVKVNSIAPGSNLTSVLIRGKL